MRQGADDLLEGRCVLTVTNASLLIGLRDHNNEVVWKQFLNRYQPVLVSFARRLGLAEQDAIDVSRKALLAFVAAYREGRRQNGPLRTWLFGITVQKVRDVQRKKDGEGSRPAASDSMLDDERLMQLWNAEWQESLLADCLEEVRRQVKPKTMHAFELFAIQGRPAEKVAAELGMTENAVWIAKNRVATRMREIQRELEENW